MFNKVELKIEVWGERQKIYVAKQLIDFHVKYSVIDRQEAGTEYNMRVNKKQLCNIINYIAPLSNVYVNMRLCDGSYVFLAG